MLWCYMCTGKSIGQLHIVKVCDNYLLVTFEGNVEFSLLRGCVIYALISGFIAGKHLLFSLEQCKQSGNLKVN